MIEPWEDPWAPASPTRPRPNGTREAEGDGSGETEEDAAGAHGASRARTPRRWSRPPAGPTDTSRGTHGRSAPSAPEDRVGGDERDDGPPHPLSPASAPIDKLGRWALPLALDTSDHLDLSGHRSTVQELLGTAPPGIRFLLWPRRGPLDTSDGPRRHTLELALERDAGDVFVARYWDDRRRQDASVQGRIAASEADRDWFDRQLVHFVERVLSLI